MITMAVTGAAQLERRRLADTNAAHLKMVPKYIPKLYTQFMFCFVLLWLVASQVCPRPSGLLH